MARKAFRAAQRRELQALAEISPDDPPSERPSAVRARRIASSATPACHAMMHGTSTAFDIIMPCAESIHTAAESHNLPTPTPTPARPTHAGYFRRVDQTSSMAEIV